MFQAFYNITRRIERRVRLAYEMEVAPCVRNVESKPVKNGFVIAGNASRNSELMFWANFVKFAIAVYGVLAKRREI